MPGEPAETMIGVGGLGIGVLMIVCAYKNKSPFGVIKQAVTTGSFDLTNVAPFFGTGDTTATWHRPLAVDAAITTIAAKNPALAAAINTEMSHFDSNTPYADTKHFFDLMSQARTEGFGAQADTIEKYVNSLVKPASATPSTGGRTI